MPFCSPGKVISSRCEGYSSRDFIVPWEPPRRTQGENVHSVKKLILLEYLSLKNHLDGYGKMKEAWAGKASDFRISWKLPDRPSQSLYLSSLRILLHWLPLCIEVCVCVQSCPTLCKLMDGSPPGSSVHGILCPWNTGMDCHFPLQGIFPTQVLNPHLLGLLHWQEHSLPLCHLGNSSVNAQKTE